MNVLQYISELLYRHDCVIVPGLGGFIANPVSASIHPVTHSFKPPRKEILFNSSLKTNDGILANYIASKENITYEHAVLEIFNFVNETKAALLNGSEVGIYQVGTIYIDKQANYCFKPDKEVNYLLTSFGLSEFNSPPIKREGIEKRLEKAFADKKVFRSERKNNHVLAKVAVISIPAAALFVWGVFNADTIQNVPTNYSNLISVFTERTKAVVEKPVPHHLNPRIDSPLSAENAFKISSNYNLFEPEAPVSTIFPCFVNSESANDTTSSEEATPQGEVTTVCSYYIIGSCNREVSLAENYKNNLIAKGYQNANIIEPAGKGLHKVYIDCFDNEESAREAMAKIQANENPNAWLLKM